MSRCRPPALLCLVGAFALTSCGDGGGETRVEATPPPVEAVPAREGTLPLVERVSGTVEARNQVSIRPEIAAPVAAVLVTSGQAVQRGQPLVRLRDDELREQLRQAEASVDLARSEAAEAAAGVAEVEAQVTRSRTLAASGLVSELELETQEAQLAAARASAGQASARVAQARATVEERRAALDRAVVRAPVSGTVGQQHAEVGMLVDPSTLLFELGDLGELVVEVPLTEAMLAHVTEGMPVEVAAPSLGGEPVRATLSRISPFLAAASFSTVGEIDLRNADPRLRPGMFVTVDVLHGESRRATLVPASALWQNPDSGGLVVFVLGGMPPGAATGAPGQELGREPHPVERRTVELLAAGRGVAGIAGVAAGEWVVTLGQHLLAGEEAEGAQARVRPTTWERVLELQSLQREDLLAGFLARQQQWARTRGAEPPSNEEFLGGAAAPATPPGGE